MQKRAQLLKEQFAAVGLNVKIVSEDLLAVWLPQTLPNGDFDMTTYTQLPYDDPHWPMSFYTTHSPLGDAADPRGRNNMAFFDDELTAAIDDAESTLDSDLLVEKVKDVVRMIFEKQAPMINLYASRTFTARWHWYKGHLPASRGTWATLGNGRTWIDTNLRGS
jgi:ABC-type transport system substrate-binding protein